MYLTQLREGLGMRCIRSDEMIQELVIFAGYVKKFNDESKILQNRSRIPR